MTAKKILTAGVDEAGRGALAGPVVAAAVIFNREIDLPGLTDSKIVSKKRRENLNQQIKQTCLCWSIGFGSVEEIDQINILRAALLAMKRAVLGLEIRPDEVLVDGNYVPDIDISAKAVVKGDLRVPVISAASILAKVARDQYMLDCSIKYPEYGFENHVGYGTAAHLTALGNYGVTQLHRQSFAPVARQVQSSLFDH